MIYSQYGCVVKEVREVNLDTGFCVIVLASEGKYPETVKKQYPLISLKADGGFEEIKEAAGRVIDSTGHDSKGGDGGIVEQE